MPPRGKWAVRKGCPILNGLKGLGQVGARVMAKSARESEGTPILVTQSVSKRIDD